MNELQELQLRPISGRSKTVFFVGSQTPECSKSPESARKSMPAETISLNEVAMISCWKHLNGIKESDDNNNSDSYHRSVSVPSFIRISKRLSKVSSYLDEIEDVDTDRTSYMAGDDTDAYIFHSDSGSMGMKNDKVLQLPQQHRISSQPNLCKMVTTAPKQPAYRISSCPPMHYPPLIENKIKRFSMPLPVLREKELLQYYNVSKDLCDNVESFSDMVPEFFQSIRSTLQRDIGDEMLHNHEPLETAKACYEVLYIGRAKIKGKKIQSNHIDDLVLQLEAKDNQTSQTSDKDVPSDRRRHKSDSSVQSVPSALDEISVQENELQKLSQMTVGQGVETQDDSSTGSHDGIHQPLPGASLECSSSSDHLSDGHTSAENIIDNLSQSDSADQLKDMFFRLQNHPESHCFEKQDLHDSQMKSTNRTMLFRIGTSEISLISLDKKQIIIERKFKNISSVSQGILKSDVFGFISRESDNQLICHLLRCCSNILVDEIMNALRTSFQNAYVQRLHMQPICSNCPLQQYNKLCQDINGLNAENAYNLLSNRLQQLPEKDAFELYHSLKNDNPQSYKESVELLMVNLRKMCEHKQKDHTHILNSSKGPNKNEFFLVDMKGKTNQRSAFDFFRPRAKKKSLIPFESLFTSVHKTGEVKGALPNRVNTNDEVLANKISDNSLNQDPDTKDNKKFDCSSPPSYPKGSRPRSATLGEIPHVNTFVKQIEKQKAEELDIEKQQAIGSLLKHMFNVVMSSSPQCSSSEHSDDVTESQRMPNGNNQYSQGSLRQNIFKQVVTPTKPSMNSAVGEITDKDARSATKRTHDELKAMWKKAIMETRLLIRMERENQDLCARQDKMYVKRQKLDYAEITPCLKDVTRTWEEMLNTPNRQANKFDFEIILNCVKQGVPQSKRGDVWWLLVEQHRLQYPDIESETPKVDYTELLKQLTTHQHAILIDLGRTFPGHPYFSIQLGNGQLALFNMLKAYSLLDQDVGYCQGLSFVAGILLMHMEETTAFEAWKHLMYNLGLRKQYRQNMVALQIQLYQLTRLIHDNYKDLYDHFERHEIAPTLYAAPWFLTLFASQFPLGFVARVFDLLFMQGKEVIFKVALVLLGYHKELILQCDSFETIVEFIKTTLPAMGMNQMERVINQVFDLDISKQLQAYQVEYHVLKEEMMYAHQQHDDGTLEKLELGNYNLRQQNMELAEKLEHAHSQINCQENMIQGYQTQDNKFKCHIQMLERERSALVDAVLKLKQFVAAEKLTSEFDLSILAPSMFMSSLNCSSHSENLESQDSQEGHHCINEKYHEEDKRDSKDGHFMHSKEQDKISTDKEEVNKVQREISALQEEVSTVQVQDSTALGEGNILHGEDSTLPREVIIDKKLDINDLTANCLKSA